MQDDRKMTQDSTMEEETVMLPDGIEWVKPGVLRCDRCKVEEKVSSKNDGHLTFCTRHAFCEYDPSMRLASTMTIREHIILELIKKMVSPTASYGEEDFLVQRATRIADHMLSALKRPTYVESSISEEEFNSIAESSKKVRV